MTNRKPLVFSHACSKDVFEAFLHMDEKPKSVLAFHSSRVVQYSHHAFRERLFLAHLNYLPARSCRGHASRTPTQQTALSPDKQRYLQVWRVVRCWEMIATAARS